MREKSHGISYFYVNVKLMHSSYYIPFQFVYPTTVSLYQNNNSPSKFNFIFYINSLHFIKKIHFYIKESLRFFQFPSLFFWFCFQAIILTFMWKFEFVWPKCGIIAILIKFSFNCVSVKEYFQSTNIIFFSIFSPIQKFWFFHHFLNFHLEFNSF